MTFIPTTKTITHRKPNGFRKILQQEQEAVPEDAKENEDEDDGVLEEILEEEKKCVLDNM